MHLEEKEICPKCKQYFYCSKSKKCWCFEIGLDSNQLEKISNIYESCLCPTCLNDLNKLSHE